MQAQQTKNCCGGVSKVLVVASSHCGNNVICTPAIRLLKKHHPTLRIAVVALSQSSAQVFHGNPDIHKVFVVRSALKFSRTANSYDLVISLNGKSRWLTGHTSVRTLDVPDFRVNEHRAEQALRFMASLIGCAIRDADRRYVIHPDHDNKKTRELQGEEERLLGIHLGCGRTATHGWIWFYRSKSKHNKQWPLERYIKLVELIRESFPALQIFITGIRNEAFLGREFTQHVPDAINLIGETTVTQLYSLISKAECFVTHDCGVLHVAAATSRPLVALYGPTALASTGPYPVGWHNRVIKKKSMLDIQPGEVVREVQYLFDQKEKQSMVTDAMIQRLQMLVADSEVDKRLDRDIPEINHQLQNQAEKISQTPIQDSVYFCCDSLDW